MFNLLVRGAGWNPDGRDTMPLERVFEHTEEAVIRQFRGDGEETRYDRLLWLPCVFLAEGTDDEQARVGRIVRARPSGRDMALEYVFDPGVPPLTNAAIRAVQQDFGITERGEFSRTHWAVKDVDLYQTLLRHVRPRRQRPTVFTIDEHERIEPTLVSAMMPFDAGFATVYESIQAAAAATGLRCRRADDIWEHPEIIQDIVSLIDHSRVVICDCSGRNPNVFYEAGIAHTLGRQVILITQNGDDIPFDLRHLRYIHYLNNAEGRAALTAALTGRLQTLIGH